MQSTILFDDGGHQWVVLGRDPEKPPKIVDTNQYLVRTPRETLLVDPGGIEIFSAMLAAIARFSPLEEVTTLFASHQDPDVVSSLGLWSAALPKARLFAPGIWEGFLRHFGSGNIEHAPVPDEGGPLRIGGIELKMIPAHYLHASGNLHLYDPKAKLLMSGDLGAAIEPAGSPLFVDDFDAHVERMRYFHQRWMPSEAAKLRWLERVRALDIEIMAPQHGRLFRGADVKRFFDWFQALEVGTAP